MKASMEALKKGTTEGPSSTQTSSGVNTERVRRRMINVFTLMSAVVTIAVGVVIGLKIADTVKAQMIESFALTTASQVQGTVNSFVTPNDMQRPFTGKRYDDFYAHINKSIADTHVVKVKLWRLDSTVLFSNDPKIVGKKFKTKPSLQTALDGKPFYAVTDLKASENVREASEYDRLLEIYFPVSLDPNKPDKVDAVYEVYMSMVPLEAYARSVMISLAIGLGVLILLLVVIAEIASQMLRKRNDQLRDLSAKLEMRADTDGLTGLYNHRHFQAFLEREINRALRYNEPLSLLIVDLDFFKSINDRFGHQIGDEVLRQVAGIFDGVLRNVDYAARYGGEEFVAVLPGTDARGAIAVAERLREAAETLCIEVGPEVSGQPKVTLSCGVADFPSCATERESLIAAADSALLFAKRKGRNRVCYFRDITGADIEEGDLEKLVSRLQHASMPTIQALVAAVDSRDSYGRTRGRNVSSLAGRFASMVGLEENLAHALNMAAQVHDIGKITVPERVLGKSEPLTETEMEAIRTHPEASAKIVESASQIEQLLSAVLHHHENWDGSGYPKGLKAEAIPYLARMLRIVDAYEAMISDRPYRQAMDEDAALAELRKNAGKHFDPDLVEKFITSIAKSRTADAGSTSQEDSAAPVL